MYGEIDLESYTISIIRLNTAFQKLENSDSIQEIKALLEESLDDLEKLYMEIVDDLNNDAKDIREEQERASGGFGKIIQRHCG